MAYSTQAIRNVALVGQAGAGKTQLVEISEYQSRLKSLTGGEGTYTMELSHYDPAPSRKQQELTQAWRPREAEE